MRALIDLGSVHRKKILRQHRDLRGVLRAILTAISDPEAPDCRPFSVLVSLTVRLQNLFEKHVAFEEPTLIAHCAPDDRTPLDQLVKDHRRQRAELSLLAKLAFQNVAQAGVPGAFRTLIGDLVVDMDVEERDLLHGVRRRARKDPKEARPGG